MSLSPWHDVKKHIHQLLLRKELLLNTRLLSTTLHLCKDHNADNDQK